MILRTLKLLLPALIPSWRFFDTIAPSPRIEVALLPDEKAEAVNWQEFRPRPDHRSPFTILKSLFWNPRWNESLFLVSCAERLMNGEEEFAREEIFRRIRRDDADGGFIQFRLVFQVREGGEVQKHIVYTSPVRACEKAGAA